MWERFSFYGLRAILFLYMTTEISKGGLAFERPYAGLIMGTYTSGVYWTPLLGGWIADKWLGARRAVLVGGIIIACGHFFNGHRVHANLLSGLGTDRPRHRLLKPNVSTMVGDLYDEGDPRRDAGFSIFYMGINLGALLAPLVVGYLGQRVDWHYGFGAAGVFMVLGLIQYVLGRDRLRGAGEKKTKKNWPISPHSGRPEMRLRSRLTLSPERSRLWAVQWAFGPGCVGVVPAGLAGYSRAWSELSLATLSVLCASWIARRRCASALSLSYSCSQ